MNTEDGNSTFPDDAISLLWGPSKPKTRGPKPAYSLEDLLNAAIRIADKEGLAAVSMQRLSQEFGFTKMAVYRYVPGRAELVALMTDYGLGRPPSRFDTGTWRERMVAWAVAVFGLFVAHPWGLDATKGARVVGPNEAAWVEAGLRILAGTGLTGPDRLDVLAVITGHLRTIAQIAAGSGPTIGLEEGTDSVMARAMKGREAEFPEFSAAIGASIDKSLSTDVLGFGINCILDGVEWRLTRTATRT